jgi:hypothetical protein
LCVLLREFKIIFIRFLRESFGRNEPLAFKESNQHTAPMNIYEIIGYFASFFIAISLVSVNIVRLRILNLIGCLAFLIYAFFIGSIPIGVTNGFILIVNIYHLIKLFGADTSAFAYLEIGEDRKGQVLGFIEHFKEDIAHHFPLFHPSQLDSGFSQSGRILLALNELKTVGITFFTPVEALPRTGSVEEAQILDYINQELYPESTVYLSIDYIEKKYRNIGVDQKLYNKISSLVPRGFLFMVAPGVTDNKNNHRFMTKNGYRVVKTFGKYSLYLKNLEE